MAVISTRVTIYMPVLDEGNVVYRPVIAETSERLVFRILPPENAIPQVENWLFAPGSFVKCEHQILGGSAALVAKELVDF